MIVGVDQEVEFEGEEIVLEVGGTIQDGWTIAPLAHPGVKPMHANRPFSHIANYDGN